MADVNPPRGLSEEQAIRAAKALQADMAAMVDDVTATVRAEVGGLKNLIPRSAPRTTEAGADPLQSARRLNEVERANVDAAAQRLEILRAQTGELAKQQELLRTEAGLNRAGGVSRGGVIVPAPAGPLRSQGATGPVGGGVRAAEEFSAADLARRLDRIIAIRTGGQGIIPPAPGGFGLQVPRGFEPVYGPPQGPLTLAGRQRSYPMPPGQVHAVETALQHTAVEMDEALIAHARAVAESAGLVVARGYRPGGGGAAEAAAFSSAQADLAASRLRHGGAGGPLLVPAPRSITLDEAPSLTRQREAAKLVEAENALREAKAREAEQNSILVGQENERVAISGALNAEEQKMLALRRTAAGLAPGEGTAAMANLAAFPNTAALAASGRRFDFGLVPPPARSPLDITHVNQGPAFQAQAAENEWQGYRASRTAAADIEGMTARLDRLGVVQAQASQQMRRHGALTTEFLTALARGETTIQEFGYHIGATTAKFAGWTAAAAGVYMLLDGIKHLGEGATQTQSGLATLSRFFEGDHPLNRGAAAQGFRDVSAQLNVPIGDVATAQASFARVFKNQDDSLTAARTSIQAYKLDQISAADSQRYFTAIVQEFGLSAKDLPVIFDQISAAQRRMGARVAETLPAIARSAAAVKNAGGNINDLIALTATAQVSSGQTGNVVGTAFSRSASNFWRQPQNLQTIQGYGVDTRGGYTKMLIDAVRKSQDLSGIERTQLARAIGGPQYGGRVFQTLLGQQDRLTRARATTAPDAARGSAESETQRQLQRIDEQISKIGNNLQRIGSALSQTGVFAPLGIALHSLNGILSVTTSLIEAFDRLPGPARTLLSNLLLARIALAGLKRTALGAGVADAAGITILGPSQAERRRREAIQGARNTEQNLMNRREAVTGQGAVVQSEAVAARAASVSLANEAALERNMVRRDALIQAQVAAAARAKELTAASAQLEAAAVTYEEQLTVARERRIALQKRQITADSALAAESLLVPGPIRGGRLGSEAGAVGERELASGLIVPSGVAPEVEVAAKESSSVVAEMGGRGPALRRTGQEIKALGGRFASSVKGFADGLGWFGIALGSFTVGEFLKGQIDKTTQAIEKQRHDLDRLPHSLEEVKRVGSDAAHAADHGPQRSVTSRLLDFETQHGLGLVMTPILGPLGYEVGSKISHAIFGESQGEAQKAADVAQKNFEKSIVDARAHTINSKVQNVGLANREIVGYAQRDVDHIKSWGQTRAEFNKNFDRYVRDLGVSIEALHTGQVDPKTLATINAIRAKGDQMFGATKDDPFAQFRHASLSQVAGLSDLYGQRGQLFGAKGGDFDTMLRALTFEIAKHGGSDDPKVIQDIAKIQAAIQSYIQTMDEDLQVQVRAIADVNASRNFGGSAAGVISGRGMPSGAQALTAETTQARATITAYDKAIANLKRRKAHVDDGFDKATADYGDAQRKLDDLRRQQRTGQRDSMHDSILGGGDTAAPGGLDKQITAATADRDAAKKKYDRLRAAQKKDADALQQASDKYEQAKLDVKDSSIDVETAYRQSIASDKSASIVDQIKGDQDKLAAALEYHGPDKAAKVLAAMTQLNNDVASKADQHLQDIQSEGDLRTSRIMTLGKGGDRARLESQLSTARQVLAAARAEAPNPGRKDAIRNAEKQVNDLTFQILQGAQQDAADVHDLARQLYDSRMAIRMAGLTDPLAIDRLQVQQDRGDLKRIKRGDFKTQIEYQIALNQQKAKNRQDEVKLRGDTIQGDYEDAQYLHNIGRMTDDAYIAQLRQIMHMKGTSKQMRRQLNEEIYRMTHDDAANGGLDLNVGNIRLPSVYEVRRAMRGAAGTQTVVHNSATVHVAVSRDVDLGKLGSAMEDAFGGPVMANLRAAGVA